MASLQGEVCAQAKFANHIKMKLKEVQLHFKKKVYSLYKRKEITDYVNTEITKKLHVFIESIVQPIQHKPLNQ